MASRDVLFEAMDPLRRLKARVAEVLAARGLRLVDVVFSPGDEGQGPHCVHVVCELSEEDPPPERDVEFEEVLRAAREAEVAETNRQVEADLFTRWSDEGFL